MNSRSSSPSLLITLYVTSLGALLVAIVLKLALSIALSSGLPGEPNFSRQTLLLAGLVGVGDVLIGVELFRASRNRTGLGGRPYDKDEHL
jgi:hypothetical protein